MVEQKEALAFTSAAFLYEPQYFTGKKAMAWRQHLDSGITTFGLSSLGWKGFHRARLLK